MFQMSRHGKVLLVALALASCSCFSPAQDTGVIRAQGSSIAGLGAASLGLNGPGYIEVGGGYSDMYPRPFVPWRDGYMRIVASEGRNTFSGEGSRQDHYGDTGWYYGAGITRTLSESLFADVHAGSSVGGFFLPKLRLDSSINGKFLANKQLVLSANFGYDKSKQVNHDYRFGPGFAYYTKWSIVGQGGVNFTRASPGNLTDISEYLSFTQGHEKEHYFTGRVELGREGYEIVGPGTALQDFDFRQYSASWRQWVGVDWGVNIVFNHENTPFYRRNGGTVGIFFDF
jgi:YaiO family outer membrane protein